MEFNSRKECNTNRTNRTGGEKKKSVNSNARFPRNDRGGGGPAINNSPRRGRASNINSSLAARPNFPRSLARASCVHAAVSADVPGLAARSALVITKVNAAVYRLVCYRLQPGSAARSPLLASRFLADFTRARVR